MKLSTIKKMTPVGPGGKKCSCCFPAPGKDQKKLYRKVKRHEKFLCRKEIKMEIDQPKEE